jgi:hypothetical protein
VAYTTASGGFRPAVPLPKPGGGGRSYRAADSRPASSTPLLRAAHAEEVDTACGEQLLRSMFREARAFSENSTLRAQAARMQAQLSSFRCASSVTRLWDDDVTTPCAHIFRAPAGNTCRTQLGHRRDANWGDRSKSESAKKARRQLPTSSARAEISHLRPARAVMLSRSRSLCRTRSRCGACRPRWTPSSACRLLPAPL